MSTPARGPAWFEQVVLRRLASDPDVLLAEVAPDNRARPLVRQFADVVRRRRPLTAVDLERIEGAGAGLPVDALLTDLRTGMAAAWRALAALVPPGDEATACVARLAEDALDFAHQATEALARGHAARSRLGTLSRPAADPFESEGELARRLDGGRRYAVVVLAAPGDDPAPAARAVCVFADRLPGTVRGDVRPDHAVAATPGEQWDEVVAVADEVAAAYGTPALAAGPACGAGAVHDAYLDLARLVPLARQVTMHRRADELDVYRFLAGPGRGEADAFVRRVLGTLVDLPADEVTTLLDRLDVDAVARGRVEQVTGLDLDRPFDRLRLDMAAVLRRHRWVRPSP